MRIHYMELKGYYYGITVGGVENGIHYMELKDFFDHYLFKIQHFDENPLHGVESVYPAVPSRFFFDRIHYMELKVDDGCFQLAHQISESITWS